MASSNSSPTYLIRNQYSYCFLFKVPIDLQKFVGRKEISYSLKTDSKTEAKEKARLIAGQIQKLFRQLRRNRSFMATELSDIKIQKIINAYVKKALSDDGEARLTGKLLTLDKLNDQIGVNELVQTDLREALALRDMRRVQKFIDELIEEQGIEINKDSTTYLKVYRPPAPAAIEPLTFDPIWFTSSRENMPRFLT
jgi:hypothetical protein